MSKPWDERVTDALGSSPAIIASVVLVTAWLAQGLLAVFRTGDWSYMLDPTYQLEVNSTTTVITFLMAFVIHRSQVRDNIALHAKLDEIVRCLPEADDKLAGIEHERMKDLKRETQGQAK